MKKILLTSSLILAITFMFAQTSVIIEDFDLNRNLNSWIPDSGAYINSSIEFPGGPTDTVGKYELTTKILTNGANWMGTRVNSIMGATEAWSGYNIDDYPHFSIDVYSDQTFNLGLKVEDGCCGDPKPKIVEVYQDYTTADAWQTLYFDLSAGVDLGTDNEMIFLIDIFNTDTEKVLYFDNFTAYKNEPTATKNIDLDKYVGAYPNPATDLVTFNYKMPHASSLEFTIQDILGNELMNESEGIVNDGVTSSVSVDISNLQAGVYLYSFTANEQVYTNRLIVE